MEDNLALIKDYLNRHTDSPPDTLTPETRLDALGIDSMSLLELMFEIEDKYNIRLPDDAPTPETVGEFLKLMEQYKPAAVDE